jgi:hypothetical protein
MAEGRRRFPIAKLETADFNPRLSIEFAIHNFKSSFHAG